jgi:hypothetical protein
MYTVFAQMVDAALPISVLRAHAERHFGLSIDVPPVPGAPLHVRKASAAGSYSIAVRPRTDADVALARDAERRGARAGLGDLAERCSHVWIVEAAPGAPEWLNWEFCALLALTALGPILPRDGSTLLGVRGARELAARLR